jgi:hypothetical protein
MARKTTRLYYGMSKTTGKPLYWTMKVKNATKPVRFNSTVEDAMSGHAGLSIGCHLSNAAMNSKEAFGFHVEYVSFTKSGALAITKIVNGQPSHCVRYRHNYSTYVDLNDKDPSKRVIKEHPELFARQFTLYPYKTYDPHWKPEYGRKETGKRKFAAMTGELKRMVNAGLVMIPVSEIARP